MNSKMTGLAIFVATAASIIFYPAQQSTGAIPQPPVVPNPIVPPEFPIPNQRPKIEVVFVLDTTGSMGGLIQAAKDNIWSIASSMASAQPAPEIKMGLVAYRDRGDDYVTRVVDLSEDLDSMYATLVDFQAAGGGDGPESVNKALYDAVNGISWSQDPDSYKVVFLVGDAPPHMDYPGEARFPEIIAQANAAGIVVNTIQCGKNSFTTQQWTQIAQLSNGRYFQVGQAGSAVAFTSPFDADIARLSAELDSTRIYYGSAEEKERMRAKVDAADKLKQASTTESLARRGAFNVTAGGKSNFLGENELVDDIASGRVDLAEIEVEKLPEALVAMSPVEQRDLLVQKASKRAELEGRIQDLATQRQAFLDEKVEAAGVPEESLDFKIYQAVREQAQKKGIEYKEGPDY
jgi:hypothetical protein